MTEPSEAAYDHWSELRTLAGDSDIAGRRLVQQVSDAAKVARMAIAASERDVAVELLAPFILPEPVDPLVEALKVLDATTDSYESEATIIRAELAKRGLKIVEASHDG